MIIQGYASVFNEKDMVSDVVVPGAFKRSLIFDNNVSMLLEHNSRLEIGRWEKIVEDDYGLYVEGSIYGHMKDYVRKFVDEGFSKLSIGYITNKYIPLYPGRLLTDIDLREISVVQIPVLKSTYFEVIEDD